MGMMLTEAGVEALPAGTIEQLRRRLLREWELWYRAGAVDSKVGLRIQRNMTVLSTVERRRQLLAGDGGLGYLEPTGPLVAVLGEPTELI